MNGYSKSTTPDAGLPKFLAELRKRAGLSLRAVADRTRFKYQAMFQIETRARWGSLDVALAHAVACGAYESELAKVEELHALDCRWIQVPEDAAPEQVRAALAALKFKQ